MKRIEAFIPYTRNRGGSYNPLIQTSLWIALAWGFWRRMRKRRRTFPANHTGITISQLSQQHGMLPHANWESRSSNTAHLFSSEGREYFTAENFVTTGKTKLWLLQMLGSSCDSLLVFCSCGLWRYLLLGLEIFSGSLQELIDPLIVLS